MPDPGSASIIPGMRYRDPDRAVDWLCRAFGFRPHLVVPGPEGGVLHAQLVLGNGMIMLGPVLDSEFGGLMRQPDEIGGAETQSCYVIVGEVDAHHARAAAAGAEVLIEPADQDYGGRSYTCRDPEGHIWSFGSYDPWRGGA